MQSNGIVEIIVPYIIMMYAYQMGHYNGRAAVTMPIILVDFINRPPFAWQPLLTYRYRFVISGWDERAEVVVPSELYKSIQTLTKQFFLSILNLIPKK